MSATDEVTTGGETPADEGRTDLTDTGGALKPDADAQNGEDSGGDKSGGGDGKEAPPAERPKKFYAAPVPAEGDAAAASATDKPNKANLKVSSGKNPATGEPWKPLEAVIIGGDKIKLPPVAEQAAGPFYHERAADIAANFGNYKIVKAKGE